MYLELLRQDKKEIFRAAKDAQAIADLILDRHPRLRLEQGMAAPRTGSPEPGGRMPDTADPSASIRNFDDLLIAHQRLISGALREIIRRGDDEGYLGRLVRDLDSGPSTVHPIHGPIRVGGRGSAASQSSTADAGSQWWLI